MVGESDGGEKVDGMKRSSAERGMKREKVMDGWK